MKKTLSILIHFLCVLVLAAGTFVVCEHSSSGYGLSWLDDTDFEDSVRFAEMVSQDVSYLKRYAVLLNTFEGEGNSEPNLDKIIVSATTSNGGMTYTMSDLINIGAKFGYLMDEDTHAISYVSVDTNQTNYELKITYKEYDPYYLDRLAYGPTQGLTDVRSLALDAMGALVEYYNLRSMYDTELTNLKYQLLFVTNDDEHMEIQNNTLPTDDIRNMGRYIIVDEGGSIETNIVPQPDGLLDTANVYDFSSDEGNVLEIGIDTDYIYDDRYRQGQANLKAEKSLVTMWLTAMFLAAVAGLVSFVFWIRGFEDTEKEELRMDRIPLEALIFLCAAFSVTIYFILRYLFDTQLDMVFGDNQQHLIRSVLRVVMVWLCSLPVLGSLYRRGIHGGCFKYSLISGVMNALSENTLGNAAWEAAKGYVSFTAVNILMVMLIMHLNETRTFLSSYTYDYAMYVFIVLLAVFDIFVYVILFRRARQKRELRGAISEISKGSQTGLKLDESSFTEDRRELAKDLNNISQGLKNAVDEQVKADRLRTDLITNVSHDIRTPLTSIINYVDLMKRENISDPKLKNYIEVLDQKSDRLKKLTEDLLEASKASSGNINLDMQCIDLCELASQAGGELGDKFAARKLDLVLDIPKDPIYVMADGRYLWRVFENLYNNAAKYSLKGTRVYVDISSDEEKARFTIKNVSEAKLNISPDELTERFVRGDTSRNTEGSGLGLSIASSLTKLMNAELKIEIDGDLYKANVIMDVVEPQEEDEETAAQGPAKNEETTTLQTKSLLND